MANTLPGSVWSWSYNALSNRWLQGCAPLYGHGAALDALVTYAFGRSGHDPLTPDAMRAAVVLVADHLARNPVARWSDLDQYDDNGAVDVALADWLRDHVAQLLGWGQP